jgi:hypothetical protein
MEGFEGRKKRGNLMQFYDNCKKIKEVIKVQTGE